MGYKIEHNTKVIDLPDFGQLPIGILRRARKVEESEQTWFILEELLSDKDLKILDTLPTSEFIQHMKAWTGGTSLGE
jgi:hypothetical protein